MYAYLRLESESPTVAGSGVELPPLVHSIGAWSRGFCFIVLRTVLGCHLPERGLRKDQTKNKTEEEKSKRGHGSFFFGP